MSARSVCRQVPGADPMTASWASEVWAEIPDLVGYEASDLGRIRSIDRVVNYSNGGSGRYVGQVMKLTVHRSGHLYVRLHRRPHQAHRLVLLAFVGPCPEGMECCHRDGNPANNRLTNLRWDTLSANRLDRVRHGTHHFAKLTCCRRQHPLAEPNLVRSSLAQGRRQCLSCHRASSYLQHHKLNVAENMQSVSDRYYAKLLKGAS